MVTNKGTQFARALLDPKASVSHETCADQWDVGQRLLALVHLSLSSM